MPGALQPRVRVRVRAMPGALQPRVRVRVRVRVRARFELGYLELSLD